MEMKVKLKQTDKPKRFEASNVQSKSLIVDAGEQAIGMRPMEILLCSLASCMALDASDILKKQRQQVDSLEIEVLGTRSSGGYPQAFTDIRMAIYLKGELQEALAQKAFDLALNKYCSVKESLHPDIKIQFELHINEQ